MKTKLVASLAFLFVVVLSACSTPLTENAERTAACKDSGNQRMCGVCCETTKMAFANGLCSCLGEKK